MSSVFNPSRPSGTGRWFDLPTSHFPFPPPKDLTECLRCTLNCSQSVSNRLILFLACDISATLKMEATWCSETSVYNNNTRRHSPGGGIPCSQAVETSNPTKDTDACWRCPICVSRAQIQARPCESARWLRGVETLGILLCLLSSFRRLVRYGELSRSYLLRVSVQSRVVCAFIKGVICQYQ
jgi:hypothetical protein